MGSPTRSQGGVPAFARGRAQEAILLLLAAQRRGHIPRFPVYADGMVKTAYASMADEQAV